MAKLIQPDNIIWKGKPSQWINVKTFAFCFLMLAVIAFAAMYAPRWILIMAVYPIGRAAIAWLEVNKSEYTLTSDRLIYQSGIFNRITSEIELYRVRETMLIEPWNKRILGIGDIHLQLETGNPDFVIKSINKPQEVREIIRTAISNNKNKK